MLLPLHLGQMPMLFIVIVYPYPFRGLLVALSASLQLGAALGGDEQPITWPFSIYQPLCEA